MKEVRFKFNNKEYAGIYDDCYSEEQIKLMLREKFNSPYLKIDLEIKKYNEFEDHQWAKSHIHTKPFERLSFDEKMNFYKRFKLY